MQASKIQPVVIGGLVIGVLSALPMISVGNLCCCLWVVAGGMVAAYLLQQGQSAPIAVGDGAAVGVLSGLTGAVVYAVISIPLNVMTGPMQRRMVERIIANPDIPANVRDAIGNVSFTVVGLVVGFIFMVFAGVIFATIGGVLGAVLFKRSTPPPAQHLPEPTSAGL